MAEEVLSGGNMEVVVRVGDTVRRVAGEWTPSVQAWLMAIRGSGVEQVPEPRGRDIEGWEVLGYLPGSTLDRAEPAVLWSSAVLEQAGRLLRRIHDAEVPPGLASGIWRTQRHDPVEVICHNDFAPYNLLVDGERLVGVIDFDMASPGPRIWDLAYLAYRLAPFAEDADGFDEVQANGGESRMTRLHRVIDAYGVPYEASAVLATAAERLEELAAFTDARAMETERTDLVAHAAMYRRDAQRLHRRLQRPAQ
ncbi:Ser/Thr protein kinase RdoA (MazF antagonist) [Agromyces cerinus]|uniref:phosphotransferase n=1 Tax=Agromyces cerinus TaxID=33878 RepID=UPI00195678C1|nr:phosphotransferase [Agromyces cerinus]MBM7830570.1 Ser/Thr protein kinase RdoA (MazF antagonist) [Agromyces cerinus]